VPNARLIALSGRKIKLERSVSKISSSFLTLLPSYFEINCLEWAGDHKDETRKRFETDKKSNDFLHIRGHCREQVKASKASGAAFVFSPPFANLPLDNTSM